MPAPHPPEFRRRAIDLARQPGASVAQVAKDLGISESGLRRWMSQDDIDAGRKEGLSSDERAELVRLRRELRVKEMEIEILKRASGLLRPGERAPKIGFRLVQELAADGVPVAVTCRVLQVSRSGFYEWSTRGPSARDIDDARLLDTIITIHADSRQTYGVRRVHAELRLGLGIRVGRQRVERLMRLHRVQGVHRRRWRGSPRRDPAVFEDLVQRRFVADAPDRLWVTDITQHRTGDGWVYAAAVIDVHTRRCVGWSIADHLRTELVVDALDMARWRRNPAGTVVHSDRGTQYTSWLFGQRLREAGLMGSMGKVACAYDNSMMESFFGSLQIELLDRRHWATRAELANAIFEWIEGWYNPRRRHSALGYLSPIEFENLHT
ncbi:IS3 family transposase, partial [Nocardioides caricicola]